MLLYCCNAVLYRDEYRHLQFPLKSLKFEADPQNAVINFEVKSQVPQKYSELMIKFRVQEGQIHLKGRQIQDMKINFDEQM